MATTTSAPTSVRVGVLALQGSFREHMSMLQQLPGVAAVEVRTKEELASVAGLIIPGGESTTMALVAERWGLIPELKAFGAARKPIWGTCAGMIFLAERAEGQKLGGQALLGGLDITVSRNFFGAQINSFETVIPCPQSLEQFGSTEGFRALFIRAPAVLEVGPGVEVLARYTLSEAERKQQEEGCTGRDSVAVAVRSGFLMATAFHPELTSDLRWHQLFVTMVQQHVGSVSADAAAAGVSHAAEAAPLEAVAHQLAGRAPTRPLDLPVYSQEFMKQEAPRSLAPLTRAAEVQ